MASPQPAPAPRKAGKSNSGCMAISVGTVLLILLLYGIGAVARNVSAPDAAAGVGGGVMTATPAVQAKAPPTVAPAAIPTPAPTQPPLPAGAVGQVVTGNWQIVVTGVERKATVDSFGQPVKPVGEWVIVSIALTNRGRENFGVNTWDFELRTADGAAIKHTTDFAAIAYVNGLPDRRALGGQVPPGARAVSTLIYDVAPGSSGLSLVFLQDQRQSVRLP